MSSEEISDVSVSQYLQNHPEWLETYLLQNAQSDWLKDLSNRVRGIKRESSAKRKNGGQRSAAHPAAGNAATAGNAAKIRLNLNLEGLDPLDLEPAEDEEEDDESTICST